MEKKVALKNKGLLINPLDDFYGTASKGSGFNPNIPEQQNYDVGEILEIGKDIPSEWKGQIVFHNKNLGTEVNLLDKKKYKVIEYDFIHLILFNN